MPGLEVEEMNDRRAGCGFGGSFAVKNMVPFSASIVRWGELPRSNGQLPQAGAVMGDAWLHVASGRTYAAMW
jgi:Fe-S oxidoreductase